MRVKYRQESPPYWEVATGGTRWWSVAYNPETCRYLITNHQGRILDEHGPTGQKVLDAVHRHEREHQSGPFDAGSVSNAS